MKQPRINRSALEALSAPFYAAQAGGFRGDGLEELTVAQLRAAEEFIEAAEAYLDSRNERGEKAKP